ncbi:MAG: hypothetical protein KME04_02755 [Pleurocapsa minor GSE-CHR-MK-17-07R]|nr:hypothetical protein [Pleurocapsa minor GSE-CHR-MK 17-07R]
MVAPDALKPARTRLQSASLAWLIIILAFAVFCVICISASLGLQYFLFESTVPMRAELKISRGTAGLTSTDLIEQVVRDRRDLANSSVVTTDELSQATIDFYDPRGTNLLVASVTVDSDTALDLTAMNRPRFDWSSLGYEIYLSRASGSMDVYIPDDRDRNTRVSIRTTSGDFVYLTGPGQYSITITPQQVRVLNFSGDALIVEGQNVQTQPVGIGQRGIYYPLNNQFLLLPAFDNLLGPTDFPEGLLVSAPTNEPTAETDSGAAPTPVWSCYNGPYDEPVGAFDVVSINGRNAIHFARGNGAQSHGETGCALTFGGAGRPIHDYSFLSFSATFRIDQQSLTACGFEGSECPLMLRIDYIPTSGAAAVSWYHGFYAQYDPQYNYPRTCASCSREHESVNAGVWYTYQSDNLFATIPEAVRMGTLLNVRFYTSGHEYDVYVSNLRLLAGTDDPAAPTAAVADPSAAG